MNSQLSKFIKSLSKKDSKSLSQKTLKATEELGELAKAILPYENAHSTNHRFTSKEKILEEIADTMLCLLSIGHDIGAKDSELEEMLWKKAEYWGALQKREYKNAFPLPYEIHITVENVEATSFTDACEKIGVKAITLDLQDKSGKLVLKDAQTSSKFVGDNHGAYMETERIARDLTLMGYSVVRKKIETVPWHPAAPSTEGGNSKIRKDGYFESHIEVILNDTDEERQKLIKIIDPFHGHLSRNSRKVLECGRNKLMITVRDNNTFSEPFQNKIDDLYNQLQSKGYELGEKIIEFSIYDTKVSHDASWLAGNPKAA
ncbi:hypothetical protein [Bdellovibrio sp. BCCA]|uniref:hypothetical protein n=1 Tax=Bdellovibrio sp. BCCA TaxID=3136281 RepID=UPI0030F21F5E